MHLDQLNLLSIVFGLIIYMAVGMALYSPILLGRAWQKYKRLKDEDIKNSSLALILSALGGLSSMLILNIIGVWAHVTTPLQGSLMGFVFGIFASLSGINLLVFDKKNGMADRVRVWLIDSVNTVTVFTLAGAVMGLFL